MTSNLDTHSHIGSRAVALVGGYQRVVRIVGWHKTRADVAYYLGKGGRREINIQTVPQRNVEFHNGTARCVSTSLVPPPADVAMELHEKQKSRRSRRAMLLKIARAGDAPFAEELADALAQNEADKKATPWWEMSDEQREECRARVASVYQRCNEARRSALRAAGYELEAERLVIPTLRAAERKPECLGHPAGPGDPMGQTVYCDGSCRRVAVVR